MLCSWPAHNVGRGAAAHPARWVRQLRFLPLRTPPPTPPRSAVAAWTYDHDNSGAACRPHTETGLVYTEYSNGRVGMEGGGSNAAFYSLIGMLNKNGTEIVGNVTAANRIKGTLLSSKLTCFVLSARRPPLNDSGGKGVFFIICLSRASHSSDRWHLHLPCRHLQPHARRPAGATALHPAADTVAAHASHPGNIREQHGLADASLVRTTASTTVHVCLLSHII